MPNIILIPLLELGKLVCGKRKEGNDYQPNAAFDSAINACDVRFTAACLFGKEQCPRP